MFIPRPTHFLCANGVMMSCMSGADSLAHLSSSCRRTAPLSGVPAGVKRNSFRAEWKGPRLRGVSG